MGSLQKAAFSKFGAGNEARTRDLDLGKVALYQLSYTRMAKPALFPVRLRCGRGF